MAFCPFRKNECISDCPHFAHGVRKCCLPTGTMIYEDLHKLSLVLLDNAILREDEEAAAAAPSDEKKQTDNQPVKDQRQ